MRSTSDGNLDTESFLETYSVATFNILFKKCQPWYAIVPQGLSVVMAILGSGMVVAIAVTACCHPRTFSRRFPSIPTPTSNFQHMVLLERHLNRTNRRLQRLEKKRHKNYGSITHDSSGGAPVEGAGPVHDSEAGAHEPPPPLETPVRRRRASTDGAADH